MPSPPVKGPLSPSGGGDGVEVVRGRADGVSGGVEGFTSLRGGIPAGGEVLVVEGDSGGCCCGVDIREAGELVTMDGIVLVKTCRSS